MQTWLDKYDINLYFYVSEIDEKKQEYSNLDIDLVICECKDYKKAIEYFKKAYKLQFYDDAICFLNEVPQQNKNDLLYFYLAKAHEHKEQYSLAIKFYKKAIKYNPSEFAYSRELFLLYERRDKFSQALELFRKTIMDERDKEYIEEFCFDALLLARRIYRDNNNDLFCWITNCKENLMKSSLANIIKICDDIYDEKILDANCKDNQQDLYIALVNLYADIHSFEKDRRYKIQKGDELVHYTTIDTLKKIVDMSNALNYRLYNAAYMNDPAEGKTLFEHLAKIIYPETNRAEDNLLKQVMEYYEGSGNENFVPSNTYLACFSMVKDQLPMWGMYGAKGTGVCCVVSNNFFDMIPFDNAHSTADCHLSIPKVDSQGIDVANDENDTLHPNYLYEVSYLKHNSHENFYVGIWATSLEKISKCFGTMNQSQRKNLLKAVAWILDKVRFLFKDEDYEYEKEYRLVRFHEINDSLVCLDLNSTPYPKVYVNAGNSGKFKYEKIILGSKIQSPEMIVPWLLKTKIVESVSLSKIQYR